MGKLFNALKHRLPTQRRLIQLYAALLYNAYIRGFLSGRIYTGPAKILCVPGFNCYSCPGAVGACPLGSLQNAIAASGHRAPVYVLGILMLYGLILGRTICGWLCPMGLIQELLHKIPTPKLKKNRFTRVLSWFKYVLLAIFVVIIPLWYSLENYPVPAFCKYICPAGTLGGAIGLLANPVNADMFSMLDILFTQKFVILLLIALICLFIYRAFCRFLCPLGAIYGFFARLAVIGVKLDTPRCIDCGKCIQVCRMDIRRVGDHECIHCGECIDVCPTGAISFKAGKITLRVNETGAPASPKGTRRTRTLTAWIAALVLLIGALWYFNSPQTQPVQPAASATPAPENDIPVGSEEGMLAPDFTVPLYGEEGGSFTLSEQRGKVVIVNFWATWCAPCCKELPYFDQLHLAHPDEVVLIAIHSNLVTDEVEEYLAGFDYQMPFALDETGSVIQSFDGSAMLPQTVVIDENGVITYNSVGSVTYDQLESLLQDAKS